MYNIFKDTEKIRSWGMQYDAAALQACPENMKFHGFPCPATLVRGIYNAA